MAPKNEDAAAREMLRSEASRPTEPVDASCVAGSVGRPGELVTQSYDADFWRQRAKEARAIAEAMTLPVARREMEHIAAAYDRLAERAERTAGRKGARERS
jgi:hypothetical protein